MNRSFKVLIGILLIISKISLGQTKDTIMDGAALINLSLEELMEVEITVASSRPLTLRESPGIVSYITEEDIKNSGARDLMDVLQLIPGFQPALDVQNMLGLGLRGIWGQEGKMLLMVDGQQQNELFYSNIQLRSHYSVDQIKKIEIIRGPGSSIYGGLAELAVINIITKKGEEINGIHVSGSYGQLTKTYGHRNINIMGGFKKNDWDFSAKVFAGQANRSEKDFTDFYGGTYNLKDSATSSPININLGLIKKNFSTRLIFDKISVLTKDGYYQIMSRVYPLTFTSIYYEAKYELKLTEKISVTPKFNYVNQSPWAYTADDSISRADGVFYNKNIQRLKGNTISSFDISEKINVMAGVECYYDMAKDNGGVFTYNNKKTLTISNYSGFLQSLIKSNIANVTIGGRYDNNSQFGNSFVPRVAVNKVVKKIHFKVLASQAFRAPGVENININSNIKPERTTVFEFETGYLIKENVFLNLNVFDISINSPIIYMYDVTSNKEGYFNSMRTGSRGLELEYKMKMKKSSLSFNYSYYNADGKNDVETYKVRNQPSVLLAFAMHKAVFQGMIKFNEKIKLSSNVVFLSKRYGYGSIDSTDTPVGAVFSPVVLVDVNLIFTDILTKGLNFSLGVFNLLDSDYKYIQAYNSYHAPMPSMGREFVFRLSYTFGFKNTSN